MEGRYSPLNSFRSSRAKRLVHDCYGNIFSKDKVPLVYFSDFKNVGDLISPYLVERITHTKVRKARTSVFPRLLGVGSVLGSGSYNSYVWGSGSIDGKLPKSKLDSKKILAVRGELTLALLRSQYSLPKNIPLGDPALLMPQFFQPASEKKFHVGIIPHYVDFDKATSLFSGYKEEFSIIDVRQDPDDFISKLVECEFIVSSSLHGLILSDAYGVPNMWARFSNSLVGMFWKFLDYYSTTTNGTPHPLGINCRQDLLRVLEGSDHRFRVSSYTHSLERLRNSFPADILVQKEK